MYSKLDSPLLPSCSLSFQFVDDQIARLVAEIKKQGMWERTTIIITAKHGQVGGRRCHLLLHRSQLACDYRDVVLKHTPSLITNGSTLPDPSVQ